MNQSHEKAENKLYAPDEITTGENIEGLEKVPILVNDQRDPQDTAFQLENFLLFVEKIRTDVSTIDDFYKELDEDKVFQDFISAFYYRHLLEPLLEGIKKAKAIEINLVTEPIDRPRDHKIKISQVEMTTEISLKIMTDDVRQSIFYLRSRKGASAALSCVNLSLNRINGAEEKDSKLVAIKM